MHTRSRRRTTLPAAAAFGATVALSSGAYAIGPEVAPAPSTVPSAVGTPTIATPGPGATEAKVAKAEEVAKVAEKTPIVPSPQNPTRPAFQLYTEVDLPVLGIGLVFAGARLVKTQPAYCAPLCNPSDLNALDRVTAGFYSPAWSTASDLALYGALAGSAALLLANEGPLDALNDAVVVAESGLSATALISVMTLAAGRPRPLLFGTNAPLSERQSADASLSFLSSHVAVTSAVAASTFMAMKRLHPKSASPYLVLAAGTAFSAFVGTARVLAGQHFITDAVGGYVVGTSLGILIPALHDSPVKIVPVVSDRQQGLSFVGTF
jgi:membrane-associated phospholipid phosphatase